MPAKLTTTIKKINTVPNTTNAEIIDQFYHYMKGNDVSENHQNNCLKVVIALANFLGTNITFYDINKKEQITAFLDTKVRNREEDPDKKWITTWNNYLNRVRLFFRWLYNAKGKVASEDNVPCEWETPSFVKIRGKKTKRLSPYLETELWDRDEILFIVKYEPHIRNKAALTLFWDLGARNHEVTLLKIKHIRLKERYGEGEVPHEAKTGGGPVLLTCSFPYVRDWLNKHPFRNEPNARLICNIITGAPVNPEAMWTMMKQLRLRIIRMLEAGGTIINDGEKEKLSCLLKTKKWNPYCIRHSSITFDSDYLTEYALKKKVRWSMNSRQGSRYIKRRMGNDLKRQILIQNGVLIEEEIQKKPSVMLCGRCSSVNALDNKYCYKCSYPLVPSAFDEIKAAEDLKIQALRKEFEKDMESLEKKIEKDMESKFQQIVARIDIERLRS
jgi:integrase/recombinase XerD